MRSNLLQQAQLIADPIDVAELRTLTGTESDRSSVVYERLKQQLAEVRQVIPSCRFLYLMGRKSDGQIFFYIDSEPGDSPDCSPPGQVYDEAPEGCDIAFREHMAVTEGPYEDRWGRWVSGLVPIHDPNTAATSTSSKSDAKQMVSEAIDYLQDNGKDMFLEEINTPEGLFHKGDLYAFVYNKDMTILAHPTKPRLVGINLLNKRDRSGGKQFRKEIQDKALNAGCGWVDYEYENPVTGALEPKTTYCELADDLVICCGVYKGTGTVLAVLGVDINASQWTGMLLRSALPPVLLTLSLLFFLWVGIRLSNYSTRCSGKTNTRHKRFESLLAAAVGATLTIYLTWIAYENQVLERQHFFSQLAESRTHIIADTLDNLRNNGLEGLASLYKSSNEVTVEEYAQYTDNLVREKVVQAWEWIPVVSAEEKDQFVRNARDEGYEDFEIWQRDAQGNPVPVEDRSVYYPVLRIMPLKGNERALGFDLGSEPVRRAALLEAMRTGLPTATEPVTLIQETGKQKGMLIYKPVYMAQQSDKVRGFSLAVLRMGNLLQSAAPDDTVQMSLGLLDENGTVSLLSEYTAPGETLNTSLQFARPVYAFGKVFMVSASAGSEFLNQHPIWSYKLVLLAGMFISLALASIIEIILHRRDELEHIVSERTATLRKSEEQLSATLRCIGDGVIACDARGNIVSLNRVAESLTGLKNEEARGIQVDEVLYLEDAVTREPVENPVLQILGDHAVPDFSSNMASITHDGVERLITGSCARIQDESGNTIGAVLVFQDITEEFRHTEKLRESMERFDQLAKQSRTVTWEVDANGLFTYVSRVVEDVLGYRRDELVGRRRVHELHREHGNEDFALQLKDIFQFKKAFSDLEYTLQSRDGRTIWFTSNGIPLLNPDGSLRGYRCSNTDISERKETEKALQNAHERTQALMQSVQTGIVLIRSSDRTIVEANPAAGKMIGIDVDELIGLVCNRHICPSEVGKCPILDLGENVDHSERVLLRADGCTIPVLKTVKRFYLNDELYLLESMVDITNIKRTEVELASSKKALEKANRDLERSIEHANRMAMEAQLANSAKSDFLAHMSHEIRTPMAAILGYTENLLFEQEILEDPQKRLHALKVIRRNGEHLLDLINDILDISKIEAGKLEIEKIRFSPVQLLADIQSLMSLRAKVKNIRLELDFTSSIPEQIESDPTRLKQILVNLVGNAIKFTNEGTVRIVTALRNSSGPVPQLEFRIIDTGIGLTEQQISRVFTPFTQADSSMSRKYGGTGLGLAISRKLVDKLGGSLMVESQYEQGSTFTVTVSTGSLEGVPLLENDANLLSVNLRSESQGDWSKMRLKGRILLAEDGEDNQDFITSLLRSAGATVDLVENGHDAVEKVWVVSRETPQQPYDIILMDMQMPVMDGYTAVSRLRSQGYTGTIIALTAHAMNADREKCINAGCTDFATKPIQRKDFFEILSRYMETEITPDEQSIQTDAGPDPESGHPTAPGQASDADSTISRKDWSLDVLRDDPEMKALIDRFLERLTSRIKDLEEALDQQNMEALREHAHKLRGAAGSYGFQQISQAAAILEDDILAEEAFDTLARETRELLELCRKEQLQHPPILPD